MLLISISQRFFSDAASALRAQKTDYKLEKKLPRQAGVALAYILMRKPPQYRMTLSSLYRLTSWCEIILLFVEKVAQFDQSSLGVF